MYTSAQLSTSGNPVPLVLTSPALKRARGLAFDAAGNLWVGNLANYRLVRINAADPTGGGSPKPAAELTGYSQFGFGIPAFDPAPTSLPTNP
ncbi:MAG: hypothetical protein IVW51_16230 [Thermaceae bacterium]|nr:hypothetical protein [Thermaceae bacterium]